MVKNYDRLKAVEYAQKWAMGKNPNYYHFGGIGGDCTNFISQCLFAGSHIMNYQPNGWFYINVNNRSPSWTAVEYLRQFLLSNHTRGPFAKVVDKNQLQLGDLIQIDQTGRYNHTVIVTKIENGKIYVSAHSRDALNVPLDGYKYNKILCLHIEGVRV